MGINKRDEGKKINSDINVTPMVDVMLVLLIIFMVITPMLQNKVSVDLAKTNNPTSMPDADKEDAIVVAVTRDGRFYLGQDQVSPADLASKVRDKDGRQDRTSRFLFARMHVHTSVRSTTAIDDVRTTGVDEVGLLTEKRQTSTEPPPPAK